MFGGDERTIAPTPRRITEARRAGSAPHSYQLTAAVTTFAGLAALCVLGDELWTAMTDLLRSAWSAPVIRIEETETQIGMATGVRRIAVLLAVVLGVPVMAAVIGVGLQRGFRFRVEFPGSGGQLLDPRAGLRRVGSGFSFGSVGGLTVNVLLACLLTGWMVSRSGSAFAGGDAESTAAALGRLVATFGSMLGGAFLLSGVGDWILRRRRFWRSLRMTMGEAREEARASKSPRRSRTRGRSRVSAMVDAASAEPSREQTATLAGAKPLLPSDPLIS